MHTVWWEIQKERDHWKDSDVRVRIILKWILGEIESSVMDWIHLAQDRD
jgi:hypothetical protein